MNDIDRSIDRSIERTNRRSKYVMFVRSNNIYITNRRTNSKTFLHFCFQITLPKIQWNQFKKKMEASKSKLTKWITGFNHHIIKRRSQLNISSQHRKQKQKRQSNKTKTESRENRGNSFRKQSEDSSDSIKRINK